MSTPRRLRSFVAVALMSVSACAARQPKIGIVGQGTAFVLPRDAAAPQDPGAAYPPWAIGGGMQLARGSYELELWFDIPRAQLVDWTVTCPGVEVTGTAGESFDQYKARRIEELRAARGHQQVASLTMVPSDDPIELPPGDVGAGRLASTVRVMTGGSGVCAVTATTDDATVLGTYQVSQLAAQRQAEIDAHRERLIVDVEQRRLDIAQRARDDLRRRWVAWGAIPRPPMPALLAEEAGEPPFPGARWTPGTWQWVNGQWTWRAGFWSNPDVFDDAGGDLTVGVGMGFDFELNGGGSDEEAPRVRDHHRKSPRIRDHHKPEPIVRDHPKPAPIIRDHPKPEPTVRDHPKSTIRVHEKDDKKDDDKGGRVRNHYR